tara:strand:- start:2352 stop:2594 length:243 start_codon:yes stop_codon:yes gene_type:complete
LVGTVIKKEEVLIMKKRQVAVGLGSILIAAGAGLLAWKKSEGQRTKFIEQRKQKNKSTDVSNITGKDIYNTITEKDIAYG